MRVDGRSCGNVCVHASILLDRGLDERPFEQAQSVISFYIALANDIARWFSILHQLASAGGDNLSLDEIAGR